MMCNSMLAGLVAITVARARSSRRSARSSSAPSPACWSSGASSSSTRSRSTIRSARSASTASTALWGVIAVGLFSDGTYGAGLERRRRDRLPRHHRRGAKGVTGLFYGDAKQLVAQFVEGGVGIALERGRRRRDLLRHRQGARLQPRARPRSRSPASTSRRWASPGYPDFIATRAPSDVPASEIAAASASPVLATTTR